MQDTATKIRERMTALTISQADIKRATGAGKATISSWVNGNTKPSGEYLKKLADALNCSSDWLLSEDTIGYPPKILYRGENDKGYIWLPVVDVCFSCGEGISIEYHYEEIKDSIPFPEDYFKKRGIKTENVKILVASGDSMEDYIYDNDLFAIDTSQIDIKDGEIYAVYFEGEAMLKQIFKEAGGVLVLHSKNEKYSDKRVNKDNGESFRVLGRQFWRAG